MMISPESYYESELKGKNVDQIMSCIRGLKKEIGHCKNVLENPYEYEAEMATLPSPDTRLCVTRDYLERAKIALTDAGGVYIPTVKERLVDKINHALKFLKTVEFGIGGYFGGYTKYHVSLGKRMEYYVEHSLMPVPSNPKNIEIPFSESELKEMLQSLYLGEWEHRYVNPHVCDGTQWSLRLTFSDGRKTLEYYGSNAYPWCFSTLSEFFGRR